MKTEILKSFSSFGCEAQLALITFEHSKQEVFLVSLHYLITPKNWCSNYQVSTFYDKHRAKEYFHNAIIEFI